MSSPSKANFDISSQLSIMKAKKLEIEAKKKFLKGRNQQSIQPFVPMQAPQLDILSEDTSKSLERMESREDIESIEENSQDYFPLGDNHSMSQTQDELGVMKKVKTLKEAISIPKMNLGSSIKNVGRSFDNLCNDKLKQG